MSKIYKIFLISMFAIILFGKNENAAAWDSTAAKFMPLQVGNVWVYRGTSSAYMLNGRSYQTYKVTGILDTLGKKYYRIQYNIIMISGTLSSGVMQLGNAIRIDSATMNVYKMEQYCNRYETLMDSLRAKQNDTAYICSFEYFYANSKCIDTLSYSIFNNSYPSKRFTEFYGPGYGTVYVKGIGIVYSSYGYQMNQSHDTLKGCVINGILYGDTNTIVGINQISTEIPDKFELSQNYPNPFNPVTKIKFAISGTSAAQTFLFVYDLLGREVTVLVNQQLQPGSYEVDWDASVYPSGVYYYKLESGSFSETKKMVLIK